MMIGRFWVNRSKARNSRSQVQSHRSRSLSLEALEPRAMMSITPGLSPLSSLSSIGLNSADSTTSQVIAPTMSKLDLQASLLATQVSGNQRDPGFGTGGIVRSYFSSGSVTESVLTLSNGKIIVAGTGSSTGQWAISRYSSDGKLDRSFDGDGVAYTYFSNGAKAYAMAAQAEDKIVVVGTADSAGTWAIVRYNNDGSLDKSFGQNGIIRQYFTYGGSANAVVGQADGSILVAGLGSSTGEWAVAKYTKDGKLDTTFGSRGITRTYFSSGAEANDMAVQADGKILVAGRASSTGTWAIVQYQANGQLDTGFGEKGIIRETFSTGASANGIVVQPNDGMIVVAGSGNTTGQWCVARYNKVGKLDTSFGDRGIVRTLLFLQCGSRGGCFGQPRPDPRRRQRLQHRKLGDRPVQHQRLARQHVWRARDRPRILHL